MRPVEIPIALAALLPLAGCASLFRGDLPEVAPPLVDMEEPPAFHAEPDDEAARRALDNGAFTGLSVALGGATLDEMAESGDGLLVTRVVENSPADAAGIEEDDLLLMAHGGGLFIDPLQWPSQWRELELAAPAGSLFRVVVDRAGDLRTMEFVVEARVRPAERLAVARYREEQRSGVVLRTATEVEARAAGLGPGGGAVVVGLSRGSPWRAAGIAYGDMLAAVDGEPVAHPQVVLDHLRDAPDDGSITLDVVRDGVASQWVVPVSRRAQELRSASFPLLFDYESDRGTTELSLLLGLISHETTAAAWKWRVLWFIEFSGGDADRLIEVDEP